MDRRSSNYPSTEEVAQLNPFFNAPASAGGGDDNDACGEDLEGCGLSCKIVDISTSGFPFHVSMVLSLVI